MEYLTAGHILHIHSFVIDETGGSHGVRDHGAIAGLVELPKQTGFGKELYPTIHTKAALYVRNIIFSHPFVDGNKRTAMTAGAVFLENNSYSFTVREGEVETFALEVIHKKLELGEIAEWLKEHSRIGKGDN